MSKPAKLTFLISLLCISFSNLANEDDFASDPDDIFQSTTSEEVDFQTIGEQETLILDSFDTFEAELTQDVLTAEDELSSNNQQMQSMRAEIAEELQEQGYSVPSESEQFEDDFGDVDLSEIFADDETFEQLGEFTEVDKPEEITSGVGITGNEEAVVNELDESNLMDYLEETDIWSEQVVDIDDNN